MRGLAVSHDIERLEMACDNEIIPFHGRIVSVADSSDWEGECSAERHLLYVVCTRARDHLFVTGILPVSDFLSDLILSRELNWLKSRSMHHGATNKTMDYLTNIPFDIDERTEGDAQTVLSSMWGGVPVSAAGIINNAVKTLSYETRLSEQTIITALEHLESIGQVVVDLQSGEVLILEWLEHNYLWDGTISQSPLKVLQAYQQIKSQFLREYAARLMDNLDVDYDAAAAALKHNPGDAALI